MTASLSINLNAISALMSFSQISIAMSKGLCVNSGLSERHNVDAALKIVAHALDKAGKK